MIQNGFRNLSRFFRDPQVGAVGGYFRRAHNESRLSLTFRQSKSRLRLIKSVNAAYRKAVFEQVGGFDLFMEWGGDAALTFKVHESGWKIVHSRDIMIAHAEKIWPVRKPFLYGTCYFPLRKKYPREKPVRGLLLSPMAIGILLTLGLATDPLCRLPIFTPSVMVLVSVLNGIAAHVPVSLIIIDGFYTTIWCFAYYLGALYGGFRSILRGKC
jgi:GT2 family glycosyltransferase